MTEAARRRQRMRYLLESADAEPTREEDRFAERDKRQLGIKPAPAGIAELCTRLVGAALQRLQEATVPTGDVQKASPAAMLELARDVTKLVDHTGHSEDDVELAAKYTAQVLERLECAETGTDKD